MSTDKSGGAAPGQRGISNGPNSRPLDDTISQSAPGLPDDSGRPVEITPEEEARIRRRIERPDGPPPGKDSALG